MNRKPFAAALILAALIGMTACGAHDPDKNDAPVASAWATSADGTLLLSPLTTRPAPTSAPTGADDSVTVDPDSARQTITGFGAALTHSSAALLMALPTTERESLLEELFDPEGDVRLNVVRVPFGGSDFVAEPAYTYDDRPAGEDDWQLSHFSTERDEETIRPILRAILEIAPDVQLIASPWSPPAWMKDSGSLSGGRLRDDDRIFTTYADYLRRALAEYAEAGTPIYALTVQNEPQARHPDGYPGTDMPVEDQVRLIDALGPLLADAQPPTQLLAYDHNWALHPADDDGSTETEYPAAVLSSDAARWVSGVAYHCYSGEAWRQSQLHDQFPDAGIHVTECSGSHAPGESADTIFANTFSWQARNLLVASLGNWAETVLTWNLVLDPDGGPHIGGCDTCTGVVTVDGDQVTSRNAEYSVLAHAARFVPRGSVTLDTAEEGDSPLSHTAFRTPDGAIVALLYNDAPDMRTARISTGATETLLDIPGHGLVTVRFRR